MNTTLRSASLIVFFYLLTISATFAQNLKLDEIATCITSKNYPDCLFEMVEAKGFYRIDKQYLPYCDRVIYVLQKADKPVMFVNPVICPKPQRSEIYPVRVKTELELQFQKGGQAQFESMSAQIRKIAKLIQPENGMVSEPKSNETKRVYRHEATGITYVIIKSSPASFIYLLK
ncbi:hypothetical protein [Adhaeribacter terreus]|uniref:Uncharacterized protein n=1 Tax=Adhaeribacter terreus TaxID=529703 RepID=A0ABW0ECS8_9BACT